MESEKKNLIAEHALLSEENFLLTAQVEKAFEEVMNRLINALLKKLDAELQHELGSEWAIENYFDDKAFALWCFKIYKNKWVHKDDPLYWIGFAPDRRRLGNFHFYTMRDDDIVKPALPSVNQALNNNYKKGRKGATSDWYQYVDSDYMNWTDDETLVKLYRQDDMVQYFKEQFIKIKDIIEPIVDKEIKKYCSK